MRESRRSLLVMLAVLSTSAAIEKIAFGQAPPKRVPFPTPPTGEEQDNPAESNASNRDSQAARRAALQQNEKEFREGVSRLYQLTGQLKQDVDKTPTAEVFSVPMYRRMEEIAKLAKQLQGRAKG